MFLSISFSLFLIKFIITLRACGIQIILKFILFNCCLSIENVACGENQQEANYIRKG